MTDINPYRSSELAPESDFDARSRGVSFGRIVVAWLCFLAFGIGGSVLTSITLVYLSVHLCEYFEIGRRAVEEVITLVGFGSLLLATFPGYWLSLKIVRSPKSSG